MHLTQVELINFRGFERLQIALHPEITLVLGPNGAGKSALIDGLTIGLRQLAPNATGPSISTRDIRTRVVERDGFAALEPQDPCVIVMEAQIEDQEMQWRERATAVAGTVSNAPDALVQLWQRYGDSHYDVPVIAAFSAGRVGPQFVAPHDSMPTRSTTWERWWSYDAHYSNLIGWLRRETYADVQRGTRLPQLEGVLRAISACVGVRDVWFDIRTDEVRVRLEDDRVLPLDALSDGYRSVISVVGVLAWRATVTNPQHGAQAAAKSPGIVLIDEVDLHLHPAWQRRVLGDLRRTFPRFQFVATTHSPQVVASAHRDWVRVLDGQTARGVDYVEGRDSNALLEDVFGVSERPSDTRRELADLFDLIDAGDRPNAEARLDALEGRLGPDDGDLVRARWLLRLETP